MIQQAPADQPMIIGQISGVFGVHGWVKIFSFTEPRNNILNYKPWLVRNKSGWQAIEIVKGRTQGKTLVAQLKGVDDRDKAHALIGCDIAIESAQLKALDKNDFYWRDLIGLDVEGVSSTDSNDRVLENRIGKVKSMMATGANDVLVVVGIDDTGKKKETLIPYLMGDVVKSVDLDKKLIRVDWDESFNE